MRIKSIYINNFKSLIDFKIGLEKFNCIVGLNGSGKSTFLQAVDFLAQFVRGNMEIWFDERGWQSGDVKFKLEEKQSKKIRFSVDFITDNNSVLTWNGLYSGVKQCCTSESIVETDTAGNTRTLFKVKDNKYTIVVADGQAKISETINFKYTGSIMSQLADKVLALGDWLVEIRDFMKSIKSLDLLSPDTLKMASKAMGDIGLGGEHFPSFLKSLTDEQHENILKDMRQFYPRLSNFRVTAQRGGVKRVVFEEDCESKGKITFEARHINDGLIRTLAIVAQTQMKRSLVMFDEIENGINPELMEALVDYLINCNSQVIVTTHNPMILNYIPDETARTAIDFFYKKDGETRTVKFFELAETAEKSAYLAPGEVFVDTNLTELSNRLAKQEGENV